MSFLERNSMLNAQNVRQKKKALKFLKQTFESQNNHQHRQKSKTRSDLQQLLHQIKVQQLKDTFTKNICKNNIYDKVHNCQLLSQADKDKLRFFQSKGYKLKYHRYALSILYISELVFLILVFYLTAFMAFLDHFVHSHTQSTLLVELTLIVTTFLCLSKITISSTTQKIRNGILLEYVSDIFVDYAKKWTLFIDLIYFFIIVSLLFQCILHDSTKSIRRLSALLFFWSIVKIASSRQNLTIVRTTFINSSVKDQYYKLVKVIIFNFIFAHFITAMLLAMAHLNTEQNWLIAKNLQYQIWYVQYMWGCYWASTIMTSVGFGDFVASTYQEAYIVSFLQLFSCIVLAYNISQIGNIVWAMRSSDHSYISKIAVFKRMAEHNEISHDLKIQIQGYLREEKQIKQKFQFNQQNQLLNSLPELLKRRFIRQSNERIFKFLPFFKDLHKNTLYQLMQSFSSKVCYPGEKLSKSNEINDSIMILKDGKVGFIYKKYEAFLNGIIVEEVSILNQEVLNRDGQYQMKTIPILLTSEFLSPGKVMNYDINTLAYSYVFQIKIQDFITIIKQNHIDAQGFFNIIHAHGANLREWDQFICQRCSKRQKSEKEKSERHYNDSNQFKNRQVEIVYYHNKFNCPKLHYIPLKSVILLKYIKSPEMKNSRIVKYKRKKPRNQNCLLLRKDFYVIYQRKTFINQKMKFQKFVADSMSMKSSKALRKSKKISLNFGKLRKNNTYSEGGLGLFTRKITFEDQVNQKLQNQFPDHQHHFKDSVFKQIEQQPKQSDLFFQLKDIETIKTPHTSSEDEQNAQSFIEQVVKNTVQQVFPRQISLRFWQLEIDIMANYCNYFPKSNPSQFDNLRLCHSIQHEKKKSFCMIAQVLKNYRPKSFVKDSFKMQNQCEQAYKAMNPESRHKQIREDTTDKKDKLLSKFQKTNNFPKQQFSQLTFVNPDQLIIPQENLNQIQSSLNQEMDDSKEKLSYDCD